MLLNRAAQRTLLIKADAMEEAGASIAEICEILRISRGELRSMRKQEELIYSVPGPWQREFKGKVWTDMPGHDWFSKRCNFALFRRGWKIFDRLHHGKLLKPRRKKEIIDPEAQAPDVAPVAAGIEW